MGTGKGGGPLLQIGFIADADCAPIVFAYESGLFEKYELQVELHRETRWASIRDKVIHGDLDCAHAPATLPFITNIGLDSDECACISGMVLSLQGNAITISRELWEGGVRDATALRELIYAKWGRRTFTLGVTFPHSPSFFVLRDWLKAGGILPGIEVRMVVVPPAQLFPMLKLGYLDGFCGGEPWTTLAVDAGIGYKLASSSALAPLHPEKVLMSRRDFATDRADEHERVIAALLEACAFCDEPANQPVLAEILSRARYVNAPRDCLLDCLTADRPAPTGSARSGMLFHGFNANEPSDTKASWVVTKLYELMDENILHAPALRRTPVVRNIFRRDIFERACALQAGQAKRLSAEASSYAAEIQRTV